MTMKMARIHRAFLLLLWLFISLETYGQQMYLDGFRAARMDLSAATNPRSDLNGNACALVKVKFDLPNVVFRGNVVGDVKYDNIEYWVYMPPGSQQLRLYHPKYDTLIVNFGQYGVKKLEAKTTYEMSVKLMSFSLTVQRGPIEQGEYDYRSKRYHSALGLFLSEPDSAVAQRYIGIMYLWGEGIPANEQIGLDWIGKAVAQGDTEAMIELGIYKLYEVNGPESAQEAYELFKKAGDAGNSSGYDCVARMYKQGLGFGQDYAKAKIWFEKAIAHGNTSAMNGLGAMYLDGAGVVQDYAKARALFEQAGRRDEPLCNLGIIYYNGLGVDVDYDKAFDYFQQASGLRHAFSQLMLSVMYAKGQGTDKDPYMAFEMLKDSVENGCEDGIPTLAYYYYSGIGTDVDKAKAKTLFEQAARNGDKYSQDFLSKQTF